MRNSLLSSQSQSAVNAGDLRSAIAGTGGLHVLVVDDDPMIQLILQGYLEKWGYPVTSTATATSALELLAEERFDIILSDWVMPGMDGLAFAEQAKRLYPQIPFILVTGLAERLTEEDLFRVDYLMPKPVSYEDIGAGLSHVLSPSRSSTDEIS